MKKKNTAKSEEEKLENLVSQIKVLMLVVLVVVIASAAYLVISKRGDDKENNAFKLLFQAEKMEKAADELSTNPLDDDIFASIAKWDEEKKNTYRKSLEKVNELYPDSVAARLALLRLGRLSFAEKNYGLAKEPLQKVISKGAKFSTPYYESMAYESLGAILETEDDWDNALKNYEAAIALKNNPFLAQAMMGKARALTKLDRKDEAKQVYSEVSEKFPETIYQRKADALKTLGM